MIVKIKIIWLIIVYCITIILNQPVQILQTSQFQTILPTYYFQFLVSTADIGDSYSTISSVDINIQLLFIHQPITGPYNLLIFPSSNNNSVTQYNCFKRAHSLELNCQFQYNYTNQGNCSQCLTNAIQLQQPYACLNCSTSYPCLLKELSLNQKNNSPMHDQTIIIMIDNTNVVMELPNKIQIDVEIKYNVTMTVGEEIAEWAFIFCIIFFIILIILILIAVYVNIKVCNQEKYIQQQLEKNQ